MCFVKTAKIMLCWWFIYLYIYTLKFKHFQYKTYTIDTLCLYLSHKKHKRCHLTKVRLRCTSNYACPLLSMWTLSIWINCEYKNMSWIYNSHVITLLDILLPYIMCVVYYFIYCLCLPISCLPPSKTASL